MKQLSQRGQQNREPLQRRFVVRNATRDTVLAAAAEVADHGRARSRGLLGRSALQEGEGLWIVPCEAIHTFGMRFAIDLVYLGRNRRVKKVRSSVRAWRISACLTAHSVLELPPGTVLRTATRVGDQIVLSEAAASGE